MHLIQADCTIEYEGRGHTFANQCVRFIMIKSDNTVLIHQDKDVKPVNYMPRALSVEMVNIDGFYHLIAKNKTETIDVTLYAILYEHSLDVDETESLERHGTETEVQEYLATHEGFAANFGDSMQFLTREYETGKGRVDLLAFDKTDNQVVLIEVKRIAKRSDIFQLVRYQTALLEHSQDEGSFVTTGQKDALALLCSSVKSPHMILAAGRFRPKVKEDAAKFGIRCVTIG